MISAILAFIGALPSLINGLSAFQQNYYDRQVRMMTIRVGGDVQMAKTLVYGTVEEGKTRVDALRVLASSKVLLFLFVGFALPFMVYEWQAVVYDKIIMHGTTKTDPITGDLAAWGHAVIYSLFGTTTAAGTVAGIGQIVDRWRTK